MSRFPIVLIAAVAALAAPVLAASSGSGPVLVVGSPWSGDAALGAIVARADGLLLRGTALPWIALARSDAPGFPGRLAAAGAWLALDASLFSGCAPSPTRQDGTR